MVDKITWPTIHSQTILGRIKILTNERIQTKKKHSLWFFRKDETIKQALEKALKSYIEGISYIAHGD